MTCRDLIEFLAEYLEGGLSAEVRARFERHLAVCPDCRAYLGSYRQTIRVVRASAQVSGRCSPPDLPEGLIRAIHSAKDGGPPRQ